ncbi:UNKNOWN [Stylonychia lemnae]|uniref:Uncharacterized protein n=1 Tax=Stylonychia lemnae TaxID=5949 RepID=A0A077ZSX4_STYLE|nr:UNKNOWN [Stylonychia lemnae]|eukprot:CDW71571.1 UNKNOWN [Stylonychia lemnae]
MKRAIKQNQKIQQVSKIPPKTTFPQTESKLGFIQNSSIQSANSQKSGLVSGQTAYKRVLNDSKLLGSNNITPNHLNSSNQIKNIPHQQSLNQSNKQQSGGSNLNRSGISSNVKNDLRAKYGKKDKKITDLSEILGQDSDHIPLREIEVQIELSNHSQTVIQTPFSNNISMLNKKDNSPISLRYASRDLNLSPKDAAVLAEQQMLLRSGNSASPDNKTVIESIIVNAKSSSAKQSKKTSPLSSGKPSPILKTVSKQNKKIYSSGKLMRNSLGFIDVEEEDSDAQNQENGLDGRLVFNDISIKENSNIILNSNKKHHNTALKFEKLNAKPQQVHQNSQGKKNQARSGNQNNQQSSQSGQTKRKSPSVGEIEGCANLYSLKISDITDALNEFTQHEEAINKSFKESPIDFKQSERGCHGAGDNEFQTLILNQTNATSSGIYSHDFSLIKASPGTSERNSFGANESVKSINTIQPPSFAFTRKVEVIDQLKKSILVEGRVLWEVMWKEAGKVTFESEEALKQKHGFQFEQQKQKYLQSREQKQ